MMRRSYYLFLSVIIACFIGVPSFSQIVDFDETSEGPWSDVDNTTITAPKVPNDTIQFDAAVSSDEYGGFEGVEVIPGENAWILNYAQDEKGSDGPQDTSFTFYIAYDDDFFYIGVDVKDDVVRSNDEPESFWKDDAIELVMDPANLRYDYNTDARQNPYGGHCYVNYEGVFSEWIDGVGQHERLRWSADVDWQYGEDEEIYGYGEETADGWTMEVRFHRSVLEDADDIFKLEPGNVTAFNIGIDDDDGGDLQLQYFWANRARAMGANPDNEFWDLLTEEEIENKAFLDPESPAALWEIGINAGGRLSTAGAGEVVLGELVPVLHWSVY